MEIVNRGHFDPSQESQRWKKLKWVFCRDCGGGSICKSGWAHKTRTGHDVVSLKEAGKCDEALQEFLWVFRGGKPAQEQLVKEKQISEAGQANPSGQAPIAHKLDFGKHRGSGFAELFNSGDDRKSDYIPWLFASQSTQGLSSQLEGLKLALQREGFWERTKERAQAMRPGLQLRILEKEAEVEQLVAAGEAVHPDIIKMRKLQGAVIRQQQEEDQACGHGLTMDHKPLSQDQKPRRLHRSRAQIENTHCSLCGGIGHRSSTCPQAQKKMQEGALQTLPGALDLHGPQKQLHQVVARLKYTWLEQRTSVYEERKPRAQEAQCISGHEICRLSAQDMCAFAKQCRLLDDAQGSACQNPKCAEDGKKWEAFSDKGILGPLRARSDVHEVVLKTAWHKCERCRRSHSVHTTTPTYSLRDRLDEAVYAWWMFVHQGSLTLTALHLGRKEDVVRRYFHHAATVCAFDAEHRQARLVFGRNYPYTTICEADETRIGKFKVIVKGTVYYYSLVLMGVAIRGGPASFWLILVGLTRSTDRDRVAPLRKYIWRMVCNTIFDKESHMVNCTDGAVAYLEPHIGIDEHRKINHSLQEWSRSEEVLFNVETGERKITYISTNYLDSQWQKVKQQVPRGLEVKTAAGIRTKMKYVRSAQWRMMTRGEDKWQAFCEASEKWRVYQQRHQSKEAYETEKQRVEGDEVRMEDEEPEDVVEHVVGPAEVGLPPTGFEATGEFALLMQERQTRAELKQTMEADKSGKAPMGWKADLDDASSDATMEYHVDSEPAQENKELEEDGPVFDGEELEEDEPVLDGEDIQEDADPTQSRKRALVDPQEAKKASDAFLWGDRYFEKQDQMKCGKHAVNNLIGLPQFTDGDMENACCQVCIETGEDESEHMAPRGWYSWSVLARLLDMTAPPLGRLLLEPCTAQAYDELLSSDDYYGCLINQRNTHWVCVAKHNGRLFYVDSCYYPTEIDYEDFQDVLRRYPMSFLLERHQEG